MDAASFLLGQRYIEAYSNLARVENTIILPSDPVKVGEKVSEAMSFFNDGSK